MTFWRVVDGKLAEEIPPERVRIVERERFLRHEVQPIADRIAGQLTDELDLPEGCEVVYVIDPPKDG